jgi:hypothetical protein
MRRLRDDEPDFINRHCERSEAIHWAARRAMDCFVASAPRNDGCRMMKPTNQKFNGG